MNFEITEKEIGKLFELQVSGSYNIDDYIFMIKELALHRNWKKGLNLLVNLSDATFENTQPRDTQHISNIVTVIENQYGPGHCAIVIPEEIISLTSFYKFSIDLTAQFKTAIFKSKEHEIALNWLKTGKSNNQCLTK